jgi:hypothetical protein
MYFFAVQFKLIVYAIDLNLCQLRITHRPDIEYRAALSATPPAG